MYGEIPGPFHLPFLSLTFVFTFGTLLHVDLFHCEVVLFFTAEIQRANQKTNGANTGYRLNLEVKNQILKITISLGSEHHFWLMSSILQLKF